MTLLLLEPLTMRDVEAILGPRPGDAPWADDYPTEGDMEVATWLRDRAPAFPSVSSVWGPRRVVDIESGLVIGGIGFHQVPDARGGVEIGYGIAPSFQGRGLATQAVAQILAIAARNGARTVVAGTDANNPASARVLEKNGFVRTEDDGDELRWTLTLRVS